MTDLQLIEYASSKDPEPDIFTFNMGGYAGKFFIDKNKIARLVTKQDLKISVKVGADGKFRIQFQSARKLRLQIHGLCILWFQLLFHFLELFHHLH